MVTPAVATKAIHFNNSNDWSVNNATVKCTIFIQSFTNTFVYMKRLGDG